MYSRGEKKIISLLIHLCLLTFAAACSGVEIISRSQWSARPPSQRNSIKRPVKHVIIGHTVTPQCPNKEACSAQMRNMQNHHINLGWGDIGYNFVIGGDGRVYEGAGWTKEGPRSRKP
ncbi:peptidoglycan-recognition protein 2-like isoform X2 [Argiope bruennichi]|uniref:peptidoglycan-recognition protein 2-like isoform X2 n=1 Tax=Argiope bruennichi TaxID=94029 RepID=UPI00249466E9|nr:peptidoglycan-recognition protein 2-like isoform X2 [Argiope bruennichi]